jgi:hypothetical protein
MRLQVAYGFRNGTLAVRAAAIFFVGAAAAYWLVPGEAPKPASVYQRTATCRPAGAVREEIQQLLAQGGCPGWMALANEPATLSSWAATTPPIAWRETAARESNPPRVRYPVPVRVASRAMGDDELISEEEDLLLTSPEVTGKQAPRKPNAEQAAEPADTSPSAVPEVHAEPKQYTPQELLREAPVQSEPPAPIATPAETGGDDDLIDEAEDLLRDSGDLLVPPPDPVQPSPGRPAPVPIAPGPVIKPPVIAPAPAQTLPPATPPRVTPPAATPGTQLQPTSPQAPHGFVAPPPLPGPAPHSVAPAGEANKPMGGESRCEFVAKSLYPSASECRVCHEKIYDEWSMSSHAYSFVSPMFHKFEQKINDLSNGTIGYFCYRCHTPAGTSLGISRAEPLWNLPLVAREGVTCVACHRITEMYGKTNGERRIEPGDIYAPVYGTIGGDGVAAVAADKNQFKVKTSPHETGPGQPMHGAAFSFPQLAHSEFCTSCHQVAVYPGIKLEVVWEQYRASPACKKGISCQDCHMGRIPGIPSGYECGPAAVVNKKTINDHRKHANHVFYGPGYSIAHPGVFPHNPKAERWNVRDWLMFDWRAGWGTDEFEDAVADGLVPASFPEVWKESDDRYDAREIIEENLKKRVRKNQLRAEVMENGSHVEGPFFEGPQVVGQDLKFNFVVTNTNEGHNLPTASLGAQPQLWANVVLIGPRGNRVWETGYLDSLGDLSDIHSEDVRQKRIAYDWQLFNLQTMFLITGAKGTDREFFLPLNIDIDQLAFIRPAPQPVSVLNHPPFIRMEARSLAPLGARQVPYRVPGHLLCEPGRYRLSFRMRSRTEPLYFMRFCESTVEMQRAMNEGILDFHQMSAEFEVR